MEHNESPYDPVPSEEQLAVFGVSRVLHTPGHEAKPETTLELLNTITTLCQDNFAKKQHGVWLRALYTEKYRSVLMYNPDKRAVGFGPELLDNAKAAYYDVIYREKTYKPRGLPIGKYAVSESVYIDDTNTAFVHGEVSPLFVLGRRRSINAVKLATEQELNNTFRILLNAVRYDDSNRV
jgi:hypothetical protein